MPALPAEGRQLRLNHETQGEALSVRMAPGEVAVKSLKQSKPTGPAAAEGPL